MQRCVPTVPSFTVTRLLVGLFSMRSRHFDCREPCRRFSLPLYAIACDFVEQFAYRNDSLLALNVQFYSRLILLVFIFMPCVYFGSVVTADP